MLKQSVLKVARDTPVSEVAAVRLKRVLAKVGTSAAESFRLILTDIVTAVIRRAIWGG